MNEVINMIRQAKKNNFDMTRTNQLAALHEILGRQQTEWEMMRKRTQYARECRLVGI